MIFCQNLERITFGSFLHADSKYVIDFVLWYWEVSQKIHLSFWQKTLVSILRDFLKSENKTNYIFEISMKNTTKCDIFRMQIQNLQKKTSLLNEFEWILSVFFKGLPDIKEENQIHIWNQHAKNYQTLCSQNFDPPSPCPLKGKRWWWVTCPKA